ncbi:MAG: cupin domain-containing protein [Planctomycetes bacterium]|nr:cupin domain-containing protein [Planctomycetota bacterium]MCB9878985.1 cupin domain-containing protein [Planctomycetota bacterium]MCB9886434.1 cupin domain-containing protein [Planctomycetota bacterium]
MRNECQDTNGGRRLLGLLLAVSAAGCAAAPSTDRSVATSVRVVHARDRDAAAGPPEWFTGSTRVEMLFAASPPSRVGGANVTFEPGARTLWHTHPLGQTLIVTAGRGWVQSWGHPAQQLGAGDVVSIPAGVKHWHGAARDAAMTHIAVQEARDGRAVDWLEPVSDDQYPR